MAHHAKIAKLSDVLITHLTGRSKDDSLFKQLHEQTTKAIRNTAHARTNQFDVSSKLNGLVEKFAVLNREDLADALQSCLNELPAKSKWLPEILSLLLALSDKPAQRTRLGDAETSAPPAEESAPLTWETILADDPLEDLDIWDKVERGYHSSGDDESAEDEDDATTSTQATSIAEDDAISFAKSHVRQLNHLAFERVQRELEQPFGLTSDSTMPELLLIRESCDLLLGSPTRIFRTDSSTGQMSIAQPCRLATAKSSTIQDYMGRFADIASSLNALRAWSRENVEIAYIQSCQGVMQDLLMAFASDVDDIAMPYVSPTTNAVVSIVDFSRKVESFARPMMRLSALLRSAATQYESNKFIYLDALFDEACIAQLGSNIDLFSPLSRLFFAGLRTYLRPLSTWMRTGKLVDPDGVLFVMENNAHCELNRIWHDRYSMRLTPDGDPAAPHCMQRVVSRAFASGKSKAFLSVLGGDSAVDDEVPLHLSLDLTSLRDQVESNGLQPFEDTLSSMLEQWITHNGEDCTPVLCCTLLYDSGALTVFSSLSTIFSCQGSGTFQSFTDVLFWRMNQGMRWRDRFLLTELAQSTLGSASGVNANTITIEVEDLHDETLPSSSVARLATIKLDLLFPLPVQNITRTATPTTYSNAFTTLIQVSHAKHLLHQQALDLRSANARPSRLLTDLAPALRLHQALLVLVDILHDHITTTAATCGAALCERLKKADGVDAMVSIWSEHCKELEISLLLAKNLKPVRAAITDMLQLCEQFSQLWTMIMRYSKSGADSTSGDGVVAGAMGTMANTESIPQKIAALQQELDKSLSFVANGLRGISRASGNTALEALAETLQ